MTNNEVTATLQSALEIVNKQLVEVSAYDVAALLKLEEAKRDLEERIARREALESLDIILEA